MPTDSSLILSKQVAHSFSNTAIYVLVTDGFILIVSADDVAVRGTIWFLFQHWENQNHMSVQFFWKLRNKKLLDSVTNYEHKSINKWKWRTHAIFYIFLLVHLSNVTMPTRNLNYSRKLTSTKGMVIQIILKQFQFQYSAKSSNHNLKRKNMLVNLLHLPFFKSWYCCNCSLLLSSRDAFTLVTFRKKMRSLINLCSAHIGPYKFFLKDRKTNLNISLQEKNKINVIEVPLVCPIIYARALIALYYNTIVTLSVSDLHHNVQYCINKKKRNL